MSDTFWHREEIDLQMIVDEQARKLQRFVDEATLDKAADTLANFGYVKTDGKSRWFDLFGTPERAARTSWYMLMCKHVDCGECPINEGCWVTTDIDCDDGDAALLEWLRGDA